MLVKLFVVIGALCISGTFACSKEESYCISDEIDIPNIFEYGNKTYFLNTNKMTYFNAMLECSKIGMQLVTVESNEEFLRLSDFITRTAGPGNYMNIWAGANDLGTEGSFRWFSNGKDVDIDQWFPGQPDNINSNENCLDMAYANVGMVKLYDMNCDMASESLCESRRPTCKNECK